MNPAFIDAPAVGAALARCSRPREEPPPPGGRVAEKILVANPPWWLWPHLLSLDAPLVALVWQRWWARTAGVTLPPSREIVLGLGVWLIYLADRLADTAGSDCRRQGATRHVFSGDHRAFLQPLALLLTLFLIILAPCWLPGGEFRAGLGLLAVALGYFWLIHCRSGREWAAYLPKEAVVGGMFGAGSLFFVACRSPHFSGTAFLGAGFFAAVCFLNCALITRWECQAQDLLERSSLLNAFPRLSARLGLACVILAVLALVVSGVTGSLAIVPVAGSALLLAGLDRCKNRVSTDALRVLADLVLLTPWLGLQRL